ncbi:MAG: hypothetical protein K6A92_04700 [Lachnospiraceae bacterium]|nr:hypothetical protein [Lachnospiraceae bacterium]
MKKKGTATCILTGMSLILFLFLPMKTYAAPAELGLAMVLGDTMGSALGGAVTAAAATVASLMLGKKKRNLLDEDDFDDEI